MTRIDAGWTGDAVRASKLVGLSVGSKLGPALGSMGNKVGTIGANVGRGDGSDVAGDAVGAEVGDAVIGAGVTGSDKVVVGSLLWFPQSRHANFQKSARVLF